MGGNQQNHALPSLRVKAALQPTSTNMSSESPFRATSYCSLQDMPTQSEEIYKAGAIPLICGVDEDKAKMVSTFWAYKGGTLLETKPLVGVAMNEGKQAAWDRIVAAATWPVSNGRNLTLHMGNGCCDLLGIAKEADPVNGETTLRSLFDTTASECECFPALVDCDFVHPDFSMYVVSEFIEEDVASFYEWGPFPLEACHLLVVNES